VVSDRVVCEVNLLTGMCSVGLISDLGEMPAIDSDRRESETKHGKKENSLEKRAKILILLLHVLTGE